MLQCPGNRQELLSALEVTMVFHESNVFLIGTLPLSIIMQALLKSMVW